MIHLNLLRRSLQQSCSLHALGPLIVAFCSTRALRIRMNDHGAVLVNVGQLQVEGVPDEPPPPEPQPEGVAPLPAVRMDVQVAPDVVVDIKLPGIPSSPAASRAIEMLAIAPPDHQPAVQLPSILPPIQLSVAGVKAAVNQVLECNCWYDVTRSLYQQLEGQKETMRDIDDVRTPNFTRVCSHSDAAV